MARWLIVLGLVLGVAGLLWPWLGKLGLGRLPGDVVIDREHFGLYLPITTSIPVSVVLSLIPKRSDVAGVSFDRLCSPRSDDHYCPLRKNDASRPQRAIAMTVLFAVTIPAA